MATHSKPYGFFFALCSCLFLFGCQEAACQAQIIEQLLDSRHERSWQLFVYTVPLNRIVGRQVSSRYRAVVREGIAGHSSLDRHDREVPMFHITFQIPLVANVTKDEDQADLFWLPIWPYGLCLAASDPDPVNSNSTAWHDTYRVLVRPCKEYLLVLNWMFRQKTWRRRHGRDHVFWANRWQFRAKWTIEETNSRFIYMFANSIMLATEDRWAMPHNRLGRRSIALPFFVESEWWQTEALTGSRDISAIFVGSLKARGCHLQSCPVDYMEIMLATREAIAKSLAASPGTKLVIFDASKVIALKVSDIAEMYKRSVFCPIPNGDVHTSKRFFCAIAAGCIPVIIADGFQPVYPSILDWTKFSIQLPQSEVIAGDLMTILNKIPTSTVSALQAELARVRNKFRFGSEEEVKQLGSDTAAHAIVQEMGALVSAQRRQHHDITLVRAGGASMPPHSCIYGSTFGLQDGVPWARRGCHGVFSVTDSSTATIYRCSPRYKCSVLN